MTDLDAVEVLLARHRKQRAAIAELVEALEELDEYFDKRADAEYFTDSPHPVGNEEMRHLTMLRTLIAKHKGTKG